MNTTKVTFRCKASGNTVSFSSEDDISSMRKETGYEEITDVVQEIQREAPAKEVKRMGRPPINIEAVI